MRIGVSGKSAYEYLASQKCYLVIFNLFLPLLRCFMEAPLVIGARAVTVTV
jgi:hypothetical protein